MNPRAILAATFVLFVACFRAAAPSPRTAERAEFRLAVGADDSFRTAEIRILSSDGGRLFAAGLDGGDGFVSSSEWHRGPGNYSVTMKFLREDGGTVAHSVPFEMRENDVELSGFVVLGKNYDRPVVHFELVERAPKGLRLEPASPISREGFARYVVTNASDRRFAPSDVLTQRRLMQDWVDVDDRHCVEPLSGSLRPGRSLTVTAESSSCLTEPLLEGHYRHVVRLTEIGAEDECVPELTRAIKLSREFGSESIGSFSTHAFADVPISELTAGGSVSAGDDFASTVYARDGGSACVCAGSYVGKERLRARQGMGDSICMTASELDASAFLCQPIKSYQKVGDFPFRRDQSTFPDEL